MAYWLIDGASYDFALWAGRHPGGSYILDVTRGQDCTALFNTSHGLKPDVRSRLAEFRVAPAPAAAPPVAPDPMYAELCAVLQRYARRHGTKATDVPHVMAWYAAWACVYACSLWRWAAEPSAASCLALACGLWFFAADVLHSGTHGALAHGPGAVGLSMFAGALFCVPSAWLRQHVIGHHAHVNKYGVDPDIRHHAHRRHGWRVAPAQPWRPPYRWWRALLPVNAMLTQLVPSACHTASMLATQRYPGTAGVVAWAPGERAATAAALLALLGGGLAHAAAHGPLYTAAPFLCCGVAYYLFSQVSHINGPSFGAAGGAWSEVQVRACAGDYATESRVTSALSIGLNNQALHHLFPTVHHAHYRRLDGPVRAVVRRHGVSCMPHATYAQSLRNHVLHLARLNDEHVAAGGREK